MKYILLYEFVYYSNIMLLVHSIFTINYRTFNKEYIFSFNSLYLSSLNY